MSNFKAHSALKVTALVPSHVLAADRRRWVPQSQLPRVATNQFKHLAASEYTLCAECSPPWGVQVLLNSPGYLIMLMEWQVASTSGSPLLPQTIEPRRCRIWRCPMNAPLANHLLLEVAQRETPVALIDALKARFLDRCSTALVVREQHGRDESSFAAPPAAT